MNNINKTKLQQKYYLDCKKYQAKALIKGYYITGISQLIPNTLCMLAFCDNNFKIITFDKPRITILLDYQNVNMIKFFPPQEIFIQSPYASSALMNDGLINIRYRILENFTDIRLSLPTQSNYELFLYNQIAKTDCDIPAFISQVIPNVDNLTIHI